MYAGKAELFDAFTSHADHVVELPGDALLLASNAWSSVQALSVERDGAPFWAVQNHPEYDLHELASLCRLRSDELVAQGSFASAEEAGQAIVDMEALHADPTRADLVRRLDRGHFEWAL